MSASKVVFNSALKELRIILCQTSKSSQGTRDFIEKYYVPIKKANPTIPILIRECSNVEPKIFARYERGKEAHAAVSNENSEGVLKRVAEFASRTS
ncbi:NADH dehydrogenase [ubiquinone] 1 alpha subcomplex subunit 2 [Planococcus citri]|uniref:NADH dehydrogenase [ubiquinone] 1 alpha subcomplex subunit 2 n=1 Tax=Planococcus citri TaxID=170843 RepID=UPI0031F8A73B